MNRSLSEHLISTPLGVIEVIGKGECLIHLNFLNTSALLLDEEDDEEEVPPFLLATRAWFEAYFNHRQLPPLPTLEFYGTEFQKAVWQETLLIPLGQTISYAELAQRVAQRLGRPHPAVRAVGQALGLNPILILIPCHRVVAANGGLGGYWAGAEVKQALLQHESLRKLEIQDSLPNDLP